MTHSPCPSRRLSIGMCAPLSIAPVPDSDPPNAGRPAADPSDPEELKRAIRYSRERERLWFVSTSTSLTLGLVAANSRLPLRLYRLTSRRVPPLLRIPAFVLAWSVQDSLLRLPLAYYAGHIVEKRYGLSNQSLRDWATERAKGLLLGATVNTSLMTVFYALVKRFPSRWWLVVSGVAVPLSVLAAGLFPVIIAPLFNRYEPVWDPDLEQRVRALAEREGVQVSQVLQMDMSRQTSKANAFFTGIGTTRRIVLADTLLSRFTLDEVEMVVAHELAHQVHRDTWKLVGLSGIATFCGAYALQRVFPWVVRRTSPRTGVSELGHPASLPVVELAASVLGLITMPFANAFVREIERQADAYAVRLIGRPRVFVSAMRKLQQTNLADPDPPAIVRLLLHSHPSLGERIRWAEKQMP